MYRLYISNKDRLAGEAHDFYIPDIPQLFSNMGTFKAKVIQVDFENFAETVIRGQNDEFYYRIINAANQTVYNIFVNFSAGTYPISGTNSILSVIQAAQDAVALNLFTWTYNTNTKRVEVTTGAAGANLRIQIDSNAPPATPYQESTSQTRWINALGIINWIAPLGSTAGAAGTLSIGDDAVDISTSAFLDLAFNIPTTTYSTSGVYDMTVARVPINQGFGELITYEPQHPFEFNLHGDQLERLRITCYNQWGAYYIMPDTAYLSVVLQLESIHS